MLTEEKIKKVKKQIRSGYPEGELKNQLRQEGYSEDEIKEIFTPHKSDMRSWYLISAILLLLCGLYLFAKHESLLMLIFSAVMFFVYHGEFKKYQH